MGLSNAERQAAWRERHKDEPRPLPVVTKTKIYALQNELDEARAEARNLRGQLADLKGEPRPVALRIEPEIPDGQKKSLSEHRLYLLCRGLYGPGGLSMMIALIDAEGAEAVISGLRRYLAFKEAKQKQRDDAQAAKYERAKLREAAKAAVTA